MNRISNCAKNNMLNWCSVLRFQVSILNRIGDPTLMPWHPPTTDQWQVGEGVFPQQTMTISGWNVNGYRSVLNKGFLPQFMQKCRPDFMCLNETKIDYNSFQRLPQQTKNPFAAYTSYWNFCKIKAGYSGVAIFAKYKPISVIQDFPSYPQYSFEGRVITLEYQKFYIVNIYKPNSGMDLSRLQYRTGEYDRAFKQFIAELMNKKPVIIFGDMNVAHQSIDIKNPKNSQGYPGYTQQQRDSFTELLRDNKLVDTYRRVYPFTQKYTWWSYQTRARLRNDGWRLDYILSDSRLKVEKAAIHNDIHGSDHCPISAKIKLS